MSRRIIERAWRAYLATDGLAAERPTGRSSVETLAGLTYAVLRGERCGVLAVYRVTNRGKLRRMRQWPLSLTTPVGSASARERAEAVSREGVPA
jgi:hypothetical protein